MSTILITGASRGLGIELARQYAAAGWRVIACARRPAAAAELNEVADGSGGRVSVRALDVANHGQVEELARQLRGVPVDVLLNCAGAMGRESFADKGMTIQSFGQTDYDDWMHTLRVNVFGPMKMAEAFADSVAGLRSVIAGLTPASAGRFLQWDGRELPW